MARQTLCLCCPHSLTSALWLTTLPLLSSHSDRLASHWQCLTSSHLRPSTQSARASAWLRSLPPSGFYACPVLSEAFSAWTSKIVSLLRLVLHSRELHEGKDHRLLHCCIPNTSIQAWHIACAQKNTRQMNFYKLQKEFSRLAQIANCSMGSLGLWESHNSFVPFPSVNLWSCRPFVFLYPD